MNQIEYETRRSLESLRYNVMELGRLLDLASTHAFHEHPETKTLIDSAIDQWNVVINQAPAVLKQCKRELYPELNIK